VRNGNDGKEDLRKTLGWGKGKKLYGMVKGGYPQEQLSRIYLIMIPNASENNKIERQKDA